MLSIQMNSMRAMLSQHVSKSSQLQVIGIDEEGAVSDCPFGEAIAPSAKLVSHLTMRDHATSGHVRLEQRPQLWISIASERASIQINERARVDAAACEQTRHWIRSRMPSMWRGVVPKYVPASVAEMRPSAKAVTTLFEKRCP